MKSVMQSNGFIIVNPPFLKLIRTLARTSKGGEAMEIKDAILIMIAFSSFVIALLTYIANNYKRK
ncbi:putative holin-like toxin [Paenibacillaceae bacterium WGS1546]|uniref:putative holin-like toxin n=1 Tax=Cohnella sp. WGS1546 TaxID=3366810 RepID=UPI00372D4DC6